MRTIDAPTLKAWIGDGQELAILDAREDGEFGRSHLFWANPCALSRAELRARAHPAAARRADLLRRWRARAGWPSGWPLGSRRIGCTDVAVLDGGTKAWAAAGYVLFSGVNVPSKAFGEWVEHQYHTPSVDPGELKAMMEAGAGHGRARQPADGRVPPHVDPRRHRRARRRAGLPHRRHGAVARRPPSW